MSKSVSICYISGNIFQEIKYNHLDELCDKLKLMLINQNCDLHITLLINNDILNDFNIFDMLILSKLNDYNSIITIVVNQKKILYCLNNENGKYILDHKNDNYSKLLNIIIKFYKKDSYDIIINNSYKDLVLKGVKQNGCVLLYAGVALQNDKEVVLEAVKTYGYALEFANITLQNDKEVVLEAVKTYGCSLEFASIELKNDKEIVLEAVKQNGNALLYANYNLQNDKEVVLEAIKENGYIIRFINKDLLNDKNIVLEAVKKDERALQYISIDLQNDIDIISAINNNINNIDL